MKSSENSKNYIFTIENIMDKSYSQEEVNKLLDLQKEELRRETVGFIAEKSTEIAEKKAETLAVQLAEQYRDLTLEEKQFEQDKKQLEFYIWQNAMPSDMTLGKLMMCRQLWRELGLSLIQTINGIAFIKWKPSVYGETYLALITKHWYKINVISESNESVEVELEWPSWKAIWKFTKEDAQLAGLRKDTYLKYPRRMLRYKAIREAQNILCPNILWWAYLTDEAIESQNIRVSGWESDRMRAREILEDAETLPPNQENDGK